MDGEMLCHKGNTAQSSIGSHMKLCPDFDSFHSTQSTSAKKRRRQSPIVFGLRFRRIMRRCPDESAAPCDSANDDYYTDLLLQIC